MAHNNDALYDAVVAGAGGGAQHGWLVLSTPASYTPFATNIDILATAVDLQIPTIAGGASISQINLLQSITQSVLTARYPVPVAPATYIDIAMAIAAVYVELEKLLTNQPDVASYGVNWLVADWYLDSLNGDDHNNGLTPATPLKTAESLTLKFGNFALWGASVTIHVAPGNYGRLILHGAVTTLGMHIDIVGSMTQVYSGTVATNTDTNHSAIPPTSPRLTDAGIADWTPYLYNRCRVTSGANTGYVCSILAAGSPAEGTAVNVARVTMFQGLATTGAGYHTARSVQAPGTTFVIEQWSTHFDLIDIDVEGPGDGFPQSPVYNSRKWSVQQVQVNRLRTWCTYEQDSFIFSCLLGSVLQGGVSYGNTSQNRVYQCLFRSSVGRMPTLSTGIYDGCGFVPSPITPTSIIYCPLNILFTNCVFSGCAPSLTALSTLDFVSIWDTTGDLLRLSIAQTMGYLNRVSGRSNAASYGISLQNGVNLRIFGNPLEVNLAGASGEIRLTSTMPSAAVTLTLAQWRNTADWEYIGQITLPGGAANWVDIVVPYWNPAVQLGLTFSYKDVIGTPGILSAPNAQRTATGFRLQSDNALDVSTVQWHIPPMGRKIFATQF